MVNTEDGCLIGKTKAREDHGGHRGEGQSKMTSVLTSLSSKTMATKTSEWHPIPKSKSGMSSHDRTSWRARPYAQNNEQGGSPIINELQIYNWDVKIKWGQPLIPTNQVELPKCASASLNPCTWRFKDDRIQLSMGHPGGFMFSIRIGARLDNVLEPNQSWEGQNTRGERKRRSYMRIWKIENFMWEYRGNIVYDLWKVGLFVSTRD